jgi:hypothetical protein
MLLTSLAIGFLWGTLISVINYLYLQWVIKKNADKPPQKATLAVINAHFLRYFLNIGALFVVYRHMWVLVGTAVGLTTVNAVSVIRYYCEGKRQIEKSRRLKQALRQDISLSGPGVIADMAGTSPKTNGRPPQEGRPETGADAPPVDAPTVQEGAKEGAKDAPDLLPEINPFGREDP